MLNFNSMKAKSNVVTLIMAAGNSSRFGSPKQLLKWKNSNLLQHAIETANESNVSKVFVVLGANYDQILEMIDTSSVEVVRNPSWKNGLGNSIAFGVNSVIQEVPKTEGILIMLADQPLIDSDYLNGMIDKFKEGKNQIISTTYKNNKQGVPVIFDKAFFNELIQLNNDDGAKQVIKKHMANVVAVKHDNNCVDIDTFEDYENLYLANHQ